MKKNKEEWRKEGRGEGKEGRREEARGIKR